MAKKTREKPVSLAPLKTEDALLGFLQMKPKARGNGKKTKAEPEKKRTEARLPIRGAKDR
jgi:hypothetical protein